MVPNASQADVQADVRNAAVRSGGAG